MLNREAFFAPSTDLSAMLPLAGMAAATMTSVALGPPTFVGQVPRIKIEPPPPSDSPQSESAPSDVTSESSTSPLAGMSSRGLSLDSALDGDRDSGRGGADSVTHTTIDLRRQPGKFKKCLHHRFLHQAYSEERAGAPRHDTKRSRSFDNATAAGRGGGRGRGGAASDTDDVRNDHRDRPLDLSLSTRSSLDVHMGPTETRNIFEARARERHMRRRSESDDAPSMDLLRAWLDAPGGADAQRLAVTSSRFSYSDLQLSAIHRRDHYSGITPFACLPTGGGGVGGDLDFRAAAAAAAAAASSSQHRLVVAAAVAAAAASPVFSSYVRPPPLPLASPALQHQQRTLVTVKCGSFPESFDRIESDFGVAVDGSLATAFTRVPKLSSLFGAHGRLDEATASDAGAVNTGQHAVSSVAADAALTTAAVLARDAYPGAAGGSILRCPRCHQTFHTFDSLTKHMAKHDSLATLGVSAGVATVSADTSSGSNDTTGAGDGCGAGGAGDGAGGGAGGRLHSCKVCDRSFSRSDMLTRHMRLHTGLKPYECQLCGQLFSRSDHLNTHQRTHTGERPYRCPHCLYSACRRDMITRHMRIHGRDLKAKRRRMLMYLRSDGGGGGGGGSAGSLSSGAESSYESSSGGGATSRSGNSSADSGSFDNAAVAAAAAAAAAATYGGETQRRAPRHLLLPPRIGEGTHQQRDWLDAALWDSLAVVGGGVAERSAGGGGGGRGGRRLLSPSWSGTSSESAESDYSGRPGSALAAPGTAAGSSSLPKSGSASPRDAYSDSFESDVSGVSGDRWFAHRSDEAATAAATCRSPRGSLPSLVPSPQIATVVSTAAMPTRRGLVRQDASLELEEEDDYEFASATAQGDGRAGSNAGGEAIEADGHALRGDRISKVQAPRTKGSIGCAESPYTMPSLYLDAPLSVSAPNLQLQPKQQPMTTTSRAEPTQVMSTLQVLAGAPTRQSSLSDDLGKCNVNE